MSTLLQRMLVIQDKLLDHLNDQSPNAAGVLATFEEAYALMREAAAELQSYNGDTSTVPQDIQEAIALGAQFGNLMQRVKHHLDASRQQV